MKYPLGNAAAAAIQPWGEKLGSWFCFWCEAIWVADVEKVAVWKFQSSWETRPSRVFAAKLHRRASLFHAWWDHNEEEWARAVVFGKLDRPIKWNMCISGKLDEFLYLLPFSSNYAVFCNCNVLFYWGQFWTNYTKLFVFAEYPWFCQMIHQSYFNNETYSYI